ncbi:MAG: polysaccharide export protein [Candidatus Omnitrophica bacterium]|nr:polysaccharide export protein [Candidatus Omnitrophota bacterium]
MKKAIILTLIMLMLPVCVICAQDTEKRGSEYRLGVNDLLEISVYEEPDLSKTVRVSPDGLISLPLLGNLSVSGLTAKELEGKITDLLATDYLVNPQVSVFIREHGKVFVSGFVQKPGAYEIKSGMTAMEALSLAGGVTEKGDAEHIHLNRVKGDEHITVEINSYQVVNDPNKDTILLSGDEIIVDEIGTVSVLGQVKNPGRYPLKQNLTLVEAIALAGGVTDLSAPNGTKVIRMEAGKKKVYDIPLDSILKGGDRTKDIRLKKDDTVVVPESFF